MSRNWQQQLMYDPLSPLESSGNEALLYYVRRDLLGKRAGPVEPLWQLPAVQKILRKQHPNGSWPWAAPEKHPAVNHRIIETWRQLRFLVQQYGLTSEHPAVRCAAEYLFSCQAGAGDFRGILANQYATYYTGAIMAVLIEAGYQDDPRIEKAFEWLLGMRQSDGGWTVPLLTHKLDRATQYHLTTQFVEPLEPDRSKPFSHNWTGMVLRAFAAHPRYRKHGAARTAAYLLKSRFFQPDAYNSYRAPTYWVRFEYPFWWNHLVSALDSISLIGVPANEEQIEQARDWFARHQERSGLWKISYVQPDQKEGAKAGEMKYWVSLAICRVLKRLYG
jgi:hypothetical protein